MTLVFYSGNHIKILNDFIINSIWKDKPLITIIPSDSLSSKSLKFKDEIISEFKNLWFEVNYYPVDIWVFDKTIYEKSDVIYLSWWNTENFLSNLYKNWDINFLKDFSNKEWKILAWLSAWAIIMTNVISIDNYAKWKWLWLVDFEFYPHYWDNIEEIPDDIFLKNYSEWTTSKIFAVPNDWWIIFSNSKIKLIWEGIKVFN